jgi:hypothetical protein
MELIQLVLLHLLGIAIRLRPRRLLSKMGHVLGLSFTSQAFYTITDTISGIGGANTTVNLTGAATATVTANFSVLQLYQSGQRFVHGNSEQDRIYTEQDRVYLHSSEPGRNGERRQRDSQLQLSRADLYDHRHHQRSWWCKRDSEAEPAQRLRLPTLRECILHKFTKW